MADLTKDMMKGDDSFTKETPPSAAYVRWFLAQGDTTNPTSPLHRLGSDAENASPGHHNHDGRTSRYLFDPGSDIVTGDLSNTAGQRTAIKRILGILVRLGVTDATTN